MCQACAPREIRWCENKSCQYGKAVGILNGKWVCNRCWLGYKTKEKV